MNEVDIEKGARAKSVKIDDPSAEFARWAYSVLEHHYATFGVRYQEFKRNKIPYFSWAKTEPPLLSFIVGDVFYLRHADSKFLQVAADWDALRLEVHSGIVSSNVPREAFLARPHELAEWLMSGERPSSCRQLDVSESQADLLQWQLMGKKEPPKV